MPEIHSGKQVSNIDSIHFTYNGVHSETMGIYLVRLGGGLYKTPFLAEQEIISETVPGVDTPYFYGLKRTPLKLSLTLASVDSAFWTFEKRREVASWLDNGAFAEFYTADQEDKRFFLLYEGGIDLTTNGSQEGYVEVQFRHISPYTYSPVQHRFNDFSAISSPAAFTFDNKGDAELYPQSLTIRKFGAGNLSILNNSDGGREFKFTGLVDGETLVIENDVRRIFTSLPNTYRYDAFNGNYLKLVYGVNQLLITGACSLEWHYRYAFKG